MRKILVRTLHTHSLTDAEEMGLLSPQVLSVMAACRCSPSLQPNEAQETHGCCYCSSRQEDLSEYWDTCEGGGRVPGSLIRPLALYAVPSHPYPSQHTHTHAHTLSHTHSHMALGEIVRTTLTSIGSPDHLHPEDCGKLREMWVLIKRPRAVRSGLRKAPDCSPSACRFPTTKPETAVRDEPLAENGCWVAPGSLECSAHASHGCC